MDDYLPNAVEVRGRKRAFVDERLPNLDEIPRPVIDRLFGERASTAASSPVRIKVEDSVTVDLTVDESQDEMSESANFQMVWSSDWAPTFVPEDCHEHEVIRSVLLHQHTRIDHVPGQVADTILSLRLFAKAYPLGTDAPKIEHFVSENFIEPSTGQRSGLHSAQYRAPGIIVDCRDSDGLSGEPEKSPNYQIGRFMGAKRHKNMANKHVVGFSSRHWTMTHLVLMAILRGINHEVGDDAFRSLVLKELCVMPTSPGAEGLVFSRVGYRNWPSRTKVDHCWLYFAKLRGKFYLAISTNTDDEASIHYKKEHEFAVMSLSPPDRLRRRDGAVS